MDVLNSHESNHNRIDYLQGALSEAQQVIARLQGQLANIPSTSSQQNPLQSIPALQHQNQQSLFPPPIQHQGEVNIPVSNNPLQILQNQIPTQIQRQGGASIPVCNTYNPPSSSQHLTNGPSAFIAADQPARLLFICFNFPKYFSQLSKRLILEAFIFNQQEFYDQFPQFRQ